MHPLHRRSVDDSRNRVLVSLPESDRRRLERDLEWVVLPYGAVVTPRDAAPAWVYFPETVVCSIVTTMNDGTTVESATVGNDGLVGSHVGHGTQLPFDIIAQVPGEAWRMSAAAFRRHLAKTPALETARRGFEHAFVVQVLQTAACNRVHELVPRCCRWLLLMHDRAGCDDLRLTHEMLAIMAGAQRPSVSQALAELERRGALERGHGRVRVVSRAGLEAAACECYAAVRDHLCTTQPPVFEGSSASGQTSRRVNG